MTKRFRFLAMAALLMLPLAACDEGEEPIGPGAQGTVSGTVTVNGAGQAGVTVSLSNGQTATTGATGQYSFTAVPAGAYTVTISGFPTDVSFPATVQAAVVATDGQVVSVNFAGSRIQSAGITGAVTSGGSPLAGVTVTLTGAASRNTTTNATGNYSFTGLSAGTYTVAISGVPAGNNCTVTSASVTVAAGETKVQGFTCSPVAGAAGSISGVLFTDVDSDGVKDADEPVLAISGVLVRLEGPTIGTVDNAQTSDGRYSFINKAPGTYTVSIASNDPTLANAGLTSTGTLSRTVTLTAGGAASSDFGMLPTNQALNVFAFLGRDRNAAPGLSTDIGTADRPAAGVIIGLYTDEASAVAGGTAGRLGVDTTNASGQAEFSFARTADTGPGGSADQIVFAQFMGVVAGNPYIHNGETRIEIRYDPRDQPDMAPDTFDVLNPTVVAEVDVQGFGTRGALAGWNVEMREGPDTLSPVIATVATNAEGKAIFTYTGTLPASPAAGTPALTDLPDTLFFNLAGAQAAAAGHGFTSTPVGEAGTITGRFLSFRHTGTRRVGDTVDVGDQVVKFTDTDVWVRVHHEADDSLSGRPFFTQGDDFSGVANVQFTLRYTNSAGAVVTLGPIMPQIDGYALFANVPTGRAPYIIGATSTLPGTQFVLEEDTLFAAGQTPLQGDLGGGTISTIICPLGRTVSNATCSTFAHKYENNTITGTVMTAAGVPADSMKIRVIAHPRTIQPRPTDTVVTVSRAPSGAGSYTLSNVRDGVYIVSVLHDSITATGDTVWAVVGNSSDTVDVQGPADVEAANFTVRRGDTQIRGLIVNDRDADQNTIDVGEGLAGVTVSLYRDNSGAVGLDTLVKQTTTDANGAYSFTGLREGTYAVRAVQPAGAIVLRRFSATGTAVDTAIVHTTATATPACVDADNLRQVGQNDPNCFGPANPLPRWDYANSQALFIDPSHFTFLTSTGTVTGLIREADNDGVAGMSVTLRRCLTSAAPNTPTAGVCGTYDTSFAAANTTTAADGRYTFSGLREGVYEATPNPASVTGYSTTTPAQMLFTINAPSDIETGNFTANP